MQNLRNSIGDGILPFFFLLKQYVLCLLNMSFLGAPEFKNISVLSRKRCCWVSKRGNSECFLLAVPANLSQ